MWSMTNFCSECEPLVKCEREGRICFFCIVWIYFERIWIDFWEWMRKVWLCMYVDVVCDGCMWVVMYCVIGFWISFSFSACDGMCVKNIYDGMMLWWRKTWLSKEARSFFSRFYCELIFLAKWVFMDNYFVFWFLNNGYMEKWIWEW